MELVGLTIDRTVSGEPDIMALLEPLFGETAASGGGHRAFEVEPGLYLTSELDPRTASQTVVTMEMLPSGGTADDRRIVLRVPAGLEYGRVYIDAVRAAFARQAEVGDEMRPFYLEYRSSSTNGGELRVVSSYADGRSSIRIVANSPYTSLRPGDINTPAFRGAPHETLGGTVFFELSRDEFEFFSSRAYGITAGAAQNFSDFRLLPHSWLRLTVTPQLEDELVDVAFEVVTVDGRRVPFARAPASLVAGAQFRDNVFRMVDNMLEQERVAPGSSTSWEVPFYYDDPASGGVVGVIAQGEGGVFRIAYSVESPTHALQDVEFVPFQTHVDVPETLTPPRTTCADVGSVEALRGALRVRFDASSTVRSSTSLTDPLRGPFRGEVYRAEDVTISGPNDGAVALASIAIDGVDMTMGPSEEYLLDFELPAGDYQILGFVDIDGTGTDGPDEGDPVTLPIGAYTVACEVQPVTVEFALLLPPGR